MILPDLVGINHEAFWRVAESLLQRGSRLGLLSIRQRGVNANELVVGFAFPEIMRMEEQKYGRHLREPFQGQGTLRVSRRECGVRNGSEADRSRGRRSYGLLNARDLKGVMGLDHLQIQL